MTSHPGETRSVCRVVRRGAVVVAMVFQTVCSGDPAPSVVVTDSAGVRITLSPATWATFADVLSPPLLSLGGADVAGPTLFDRVQGAHVDGRGRFWVADGGSGELRIFRADGRHLRTVGGRGEGPGEFLSVRLLGALPGDTVVVADDANGRVSIFDPEGELVRTHALRGGDDPVPRFFAVFEDGDLLGRVRRVVSAPSLEPGALLADSAYLVRVDPVSGESKAVADVGGPTWLWTGRSQVPVPFTQNPAFDVSGSAVHLVHGSAFRVRVFEDGGLVAAYGVEAEPLPVGWSDVEAYRGMITSSLPEDRAGEYLEALDHEARPRLLPGYAQIVVAEDDRVWARHYDADPDAPGLWDVYARARLLGRALSPPGFQVMQVTRDALIGVWRDELGVERVQSYAYTVR